MNTDSYIKIVPKDHAEWLEERNKGIGSSEVGTILGVNHFDTPYNLWRRKKGYAPPTEETLIMRLGHLMEDSVATLFAEASGATIIKNTACDWLAVNKDKPYLRVSPDRLYVPKGLPKRKSNYRVLECKTTRLNIDKDALPKYWWCQIQYQMYVLGIEHGVLAWIRNGTEFDYVEVDRNDRFCEFMVSELDRFWNEYLLADVAPPDLTANDTLDKFPVNTEEFVKVDIQSEAFKLYQRLLTVRKEHAKISEAKEELENRLKMLIGANQGIMLDGDGLEPTILATWKTSKSSKKFDTKQFETDHPELYKLYCKEQIGSRRFCFKD